MDREVVSPSVSELLRCKWAEENAEAIKANNERVERDGLWHKGLTPWYEAEHG